jgi:purine catabolism regulator
MKKNRGNAYATLRTLLGETRLRLQPAHVPEYLLDRGIRWVTVTEMEDPAPHLMGDELILTLGLSWENLDDPRTDRFIQRLAAVGVTALGIGVGIHHPKIPQRMIDAASQHGLPLLEVPYETSFRSIGEYIVNYTLGDKHAAVQATLEAHTDLAEALTSSLGLDGLAFRLRRLLETPVAVVDYWGEIIANQPSSAIWPIADIMARRNTLVDVEEVDGVTVYPVVIADSRVAFVCTLGSGEAPEIMRFALSLVALELSRRHAVLHGRRELLGQVVVDYVQGDLSDQEAERRLSRAGVDLQGSIQVILAKVECAAQLLEEVPWSTDALGAGNDTGYVVALADDIVAVLCSESVDAANIAKTLHRQLARLGETRVGYGGAYPGISGLRLSWLEALSVMAPCAFRISCWPT